MKPQYKDIININMTQGLSSKQVKSVLLKIQFEENS